MTPKVKQLYKQSLKDELFIAEVLATDPDNKKPKWYSDYLYKHLWAVAYYGWLVGKGRSEEVQNIF